VRLKALKNIRPQAYHIDLKARDQPGDGFHRTSDNLDGKGGKRVGGMKQSVFSNQHLASSLGMS